MKFNASFITWVFGNFMKSLDSGTSGDSKIRRGPALTRNASTHMACRDDKQYFIRHSARQIERQQAGEVFRIKWFQNLGFSKIARDPVGGFCFWSKNKLFQRQKSLSISVHTYHTIPLACF